jgi:hypothetical protein
MQEKHEEEDEANDEVMEARFGISSQSVLKKPPDQCHCTHFINLNAYQNYPQAAHLTDSMEE